MRAPVNHMTNHMRRLIGPLVAALFISACGGGATDKEKFDGDRISVLSFDSALRQDPRLKDKPISIIPAFRNSSWPNPGGFASHAAYHLELDGLNKAFEVDAVEGNSGLTRIKAVPVVADGKVFAMGAELDVAAFDAQTGAPIWTRSVMAEYSEPNLGLTRFLGISEKPAPVRDGFGGGIAYDGAYDGGRLFVTTGFGELFALNGETGEVMWRTQSAVAFSNAPTVRAGRIYVASQDSRLQAFSAEDGVLLWDHSAIDEGATIMGATSAAVNEQAVVAGFNSGEVVALSPINGQVAWNESLTSRGTQVTPLSQLNAIVGRPVIDRDRIYVTSHGGRTAAIDLRSGERIWTTDVGSIETPWTIGDFVLLISLEGELVALSREQGRVRWISQLPAFEDPDDREGRINYAGPILAGGRIILASSDGQVLSLNPTNGELIETVEIGAPVNVAPVVADGTLYLLSDDGALIALR
jgi:outer membrane protein assembly factor BamB